MAVSPHRLMGTSVRAVVPVHARACCFVLAGGHAKQLALSPPQVPVRASGIWTGWEDKERPRFRFCLGERCHGAWSTPRSRIHVGKWNINGKRNSKGGGGELCWLEARDVDSICCQIHIHSSEAALCDVFTASSSPLFRQFYNEEWGCVLLFDKIVIL